MERLTKVHSNGEIVCFKRHLTDELNSKQIYELASKLAEYENIGSVEDVAKNKNLVDRIIDNEMCMAKIDRKERERFKDSLVFNSQTLTELGMSLFSKQAEIEDLKRKLRTYENAETQGLLLKLPVKIGQSIFILDESKIRTASVESVEFQGCDRIFVNYGYAENYFNYQTMTDNKNRKIFLTEAEALQALKER